MRLQLLIRRHCLPPTAVLWTPEGFLANSKNEDYLRLTVSELLEQVNEVVPLEYAEWGLEDYVVDINGYECLHFQELGTVFREDDEVQIRALQTADLRMRKLSGRHQISRDGKHLIDGVAFGRRFYKRSAERPPVAIPPRKRIRLWADDGSEDFGGGGGETEEVVLQKLIANAEVLDSDEEEDGDFQASSSSSEPETEEEQASLSGDDLPEDYDNGRKRKKRRISPIGTDQEGLKARPLESTFYTMENPEYLKNSLVLYDGRIIPLSGGSALRPAPDMNEPQPSSLQSTNTLSKSSNIKKHFGSLFATPTTAISRKSSLRSVTKKKPIRGGVKFDMVQNSSDSPIIENRQPESLQLLPTSTPKRRARTRASKTAAASSYSDKKGDHNSDASISSSSSRLSKGSSSDDTSESYSTSDSISSSDVDSESSSESSSDSSSDASSESGSHNKVTGLASQTQSSNLSLPVPASVSPDINKLQRTVAPGAGKPETRKRNLRRKRRRRLQILKEKGIAPPAATLEDLSKYEESQLVSSPFPFDSTQPHQPDDFESKRQALLKSLDAGGVELVTDNSGAMVSTQDLRTSIQGSRQDSPSSNHQDENRRSRLDVASTRRMLFGSLGLRTPKTKEDEQKISEKLMKLAKPLHKINPQPVANGHQVDQEHQNLIASVHQDNRSTHVSVPSLWNDRISLIAEECVNIDTTLSNPPFPFQQRWDPQQNQHEADVRPSASRGKKQKKRSKSLQNLDADFYEADGQSIRPIDDDIELNYDDPIEGEPVSSDAANGAVSDQIMRDVKDAARISQTDLPMLPSDISILPALSPSNVRAGAIVAFKRLTLSKSFEPQISNYQTAKVIEATESGDIFSFALAKRDMPRVEKMYDEETGKRLYQKLQAPDDDDDEEVGLGLESFEEVAFGALIEPKLVRAFDQKDNDSSQRSSKSPAEKSTFDTNNLIDALIPESQYKPNNLGNTARTDYPDDSVHIDIKKPDSDYDNDHYDMLSAEENEGFHSIEDETSDIGSPQFHGFDSSPSAEELVNGETVVPTLDAPNSSFLNGEAGPDVQFTKNVETGEELNGQSPHVTTSHSATLNGSSLFIHSSAPKVLPDEEEQGVNTLESSRFAPATSRASRPLPVFDLTQNGDSSARDPARHESSNSNELVQGPGWIAKSRRGRRAKARRQN